MAKPFRKMSVSERVLQRRRNSLPPNPTDDADAEAGAGDVLHVAPLGPPPIVDEGPVFIGTKEVPAPVAEAAKVEAPKAEAPKAKSEPPKAEAPKAKSEAPKADAPKAEAPKVEPSKAKSEPPKVEAPKAKPEAPKAEAPKVEPPKAAKAEAPKADAPKAEAPKPAKAEAPKAEPPKGEAAKAKAPMSQPPAGAAAPKVEPPKPKETPKLVAVEKAKGEEVERSSGPGAAPGRASPADPQDLDLPRDSYSPVPVSLGRTKFAVAGLAAFATVVGIGIGLRITNVRAARRAAERAAAAEVAAPSAEAPALPAFPVPPPPPPAETAAAMAAPSATASASAAADTTAAPSASAVATAAPSASAVATAEPAPSASAAVAATEGATSAKELRDEALTLLKKSKNIEAMNKAAAAMEADPTDAMPYLVLGSALQDNNRWREARRAYELCVKNAHGGMVDECRAMLRRK